MESDEQQLRATIEKDLRSQLRSIQSKELQQQQVQAAVKEKVSSRELQALAGDAAFARLVESYPAADYMVGREADVSAVFGRLEEDGSLRKIGGYEVFDATGRDWSLLFSSLLFRDFREPLAVLDGKAGSGIKLLRLAEHLGSRLQTAVGREDLPEAAEVAHFNRALNRDILSNYGGDFEGSLESAVRSMRLFDSLLADWVDGREYHLIEEDGKVASLGQLFHMITIAKDGGIIGMNFKETENINNLNAEHKWNYTFGMNRPRRLHSPIELTVRAFYRDAVRVARDADDSSILPLFLFTDSTTTKLFFRVIKRTAEKLRRIGDGDRDEWGLETAKRQEKWTYLSNCIDCPYFETDTCDAESPALLTSESQQCSCPECAGQMEFSSLSSAGGPVFGGDLIHQQTILRLEKQLLSDGRKLVHSAAVDNYLQALKQVLLADAGSLDGRHQVGRPRAVQRVLRHAAHAARLHDVGLPQQQNAHRSRLHRISHCHQIAPAAHRRLHELHLRLLPHSRSLEASPGHQQDCLRPGSLDLEQAGQVLSLDQTQKLLQEP